MTYVFYHRMDLDGWCSAAIAMRHFEMVFGTFNVPDDVKLIGYHYGDPIDFDELQEDSTFYFLDVFPQPYEEMYERFMGKSRGKLIVIDHHKTFVESPVAGLVDGLLDVSHAACELAWMFFNEGTPTPPVVLALGQYDSWRKDGVFDWDNTVLPFQYAARSMFKDPTVSAGWWFTALQNTDESRSWFSNRVMLGTELLLHERQRNTKVLKNNHMELKFEGLRLLVCNDGAYNSLLFESMWDDKRYDAMLAYAVRSDGRVSASLYATDPQIDCTPVAKKYGGGGHAHACGFTMGVHEFFDLLGIAKWR